MVIHEWSNKIMKNASRQLKQGIFKTEKKKHKKSYKNNKKKLERNSPLFNTLLTLSFFLSFYCPVSLK